MELVVKCNAVITNHEGLPRGSVECFLWRIHPLAYFFTVSIDCHIPSDMMPRDNNVCPVNQRKVGTLQRPPIVVYTAVTIEYNTLVCSAKQKLPARVIPVSINHPHVTPFRLLYPAGNRETGTIEIHIRGRGEEIRLVENGSFAARTPSFDKRRQPTETKIAK